MAYYVHVLLFNADNITFRYIKSYYKLLLSKGRIIVIFICCFVTPYNKNAFLSSALDFPVILDGQFDSGYSKDNNMPICAEETAGSEKEEVAKEAVKLDEQELYSPSNYLF
jgi:hypothetical protein